MSKKTEFASKIGLIAATVGSAIGLGNVWRFPAETQANGGAAFLLLYMVCVMALGVPVMLAEFSLGRGGRADAVGVFKKLAPGTSWWLVGAVAVLTPYLIACYYMVVAGWTLEYFWETIFGSLYQGVGTIPPEALQGQFAAKMNDYVCTPLKPLVFTALIIAVNIIVLLGGVQKGIERLSNVMMPLLFVILAAMVIVSLSLPDAGEGVKFFLSPDFSKITPKVVINALGQALFSLSIGMGILITYSSYYPANTKLTRTSVIVALLSMLVAVMMGMIIFPAVKSFGLDNQPLEGATLVFVTLPEVFAQLPFAQLWSSLFFLLLLVAALTSTVSICEVPIAMLQDRFKLSRKASVLIVMCPLFVLSSLCSLSFSSLEEFKILGLTVFNLLDSFTTDILLPLVALALCIFMGWFAPKGLLKEQLTNHGSLQSPTAPLSIFVIRYVAPAIIIIIFVSNYF